MTDLETKGILFDMDGTLIDSSKTIAHHFIQSLNQSGFHHPLRQEDLWDHLELSFEDLFNFFHLKISPEQYQFFLHFYRLNYLKSPIFGTRIFSGVKKILSLLKSKNIKIALVTGKRIDVA